LEQVGKYKILDKIGEGAMGEVYRAHDPVLNRFVAIKTVAPTLTADEQFRQRFHREAQSAAALSHRNIVTVFEFGEERGVTYMVMELLEGTDLRTLINTRAVPRLEDKLSIVEQICDGLGYAHQKGVVHRDLKPPNIHVLPSRQVKIMDFGLARLGASELTRSGTVMGTPNYMSPEQVRGEKVDARSDVFSVGALTYELLVGHKPFEAESLHTVLYMVLDQEPEPIRNWVPGMPIPVVQVVERALAKDPARRFRNGAEMREALRGARQAFAAGRAAAMALGAPDAEATLVVEDSPPTVIDASAPTAASLASAVKRERRPMVAGATALDPTRIDLGEGELQTTARPERTLQELRTAGGSKVVWRGAGAVVLGGLVVAGGFWLRARTATRPALPPAEIAREQVGILKETLIAGQIELTRTELQNKEYERTVVQAQRVLDLDPGNAEAAALMKEARGKLDELAAAAREAREAFARGDAAAATQALRRVLAIDPRHPVAGELTAALNKQFRGQAEDARAQAARARVLAEKQDVRANEGFLRAARLAAAGDDLLRKAQFAEATRQFLEAGDGFDRARREAEVAAAVAAANATRRAAAPSLAPPSHAPPPAPSLAPSTAVPTLVPPSAPVASSPALASAHSAVRQVIADYARAIETKDVGLFKTVKPDLSSDEEKRLQEAFRSIPSQQVGITIDAVEVDGAQAVVRASRRDSINGKPLRPHQQTFRLVRKDGAWSIQSIGQ
jgi:tetratricopeptide (TPR) repeat protein